MRKLFIALSLFCIGFTIQAQQNNSDLLQNLEEQKQRGFQYFYIEALRSKLWGRMDEAFSNFQQCLQFDQDNALIYFELANLYFSTGQTNEGYEMLRKASALNPENKWYTLYLANLYLNNGKTTDAVIEFEKLHKSDPDNKVYIYRLALLYTDAKAYDKAIEMYRKLGVLTGETELIEQEIFKLNSLAGNLEENLETCKAEIKKYPENPVNYIRLGDTYLQMKNGKKCLKSYQKALKVDPDYGEAYFSLANYYQALGDTTQMIQSLQTGFEHPTVSMEVKKHVFIQFLLRADSDEVLHSYANQFYQTLDSIEDNEAEIHAYYGNFLITQKDSTGYELYEKSLSIDPEQRDLWLQLLGYNITSGNFDKVLQICNDALLIYPEMPEFYFYKGLIISDSQKYTEAISVIKEGLNYAGNNRQLVIRMLTSIGDLYYQLEEMDSTYKYYEHVLAIDPENIIVLNNYAYFLTEQKGDYDRAEQMSGKCIELEPNNPTYLDTYAWVLYKKGEAFLAKFYIEKALNNGGDSNPEVLEHYGYILEKNDEKEKAIEQWKKAISLQWNIEELTKKIQELEKE